jgi:serine/threonine protein phosphatase PrpC
MKYEIGKTNRLGNRTSNQDRFAVLERPEAVLLVLADGMGGHKGGELAANTFVLKMTEVFNDTALPVKDPHKFFTYAFEYSHLSVIETGKQQEPPLVPRSTGVACLVQDGKAWWAHVGDSRLYLIREDKLIDRTRDHSIVEELIRKGDLAEKDRSSHPKSNQVTRCVGGVKKLIKPDFSPATPLQAGDTLLLSTDGLWGSLSEEEMIKQFSTRTKVDIALDRMSEHAENISYPNSDNITAIALRWISNESTASDNKNEEQKTNNSETTQADMVLDEIQQALQKIEKDLKI